MNKVNPYQFRTTVLILWIALFMSQMTFALVAFMLRYSDLSLDEMLYYDAGKLPFIIFALGALIASFVAVNVFRRQSVQDGQVKDHQKYMVGHIITWAITESITLMGLMVALTRNSNSFLPFFCVGVATMIIHFPKELFATGPTQITRQ